MDRLFSFARLWRGNSPLRGMLDKIDNSSDPFVFEFINKWGKAPGEESWDPGQAMIVHR